MIEIVLVKRLGDVSQIRRYRLGQIEIDEVARRILGSDGEVAVEPKVFDLLVFFAHRPGQVVSQNELLESVWGRSIASDAVVSQAIFKLRKLLTHHAHLPDVLVTLRGVGFRLDGQIEAIESDTEPRADSLAKGASSRGLDWRVGLPALLLIASLLVWWQTWQLAEDTPPRIALLNVENATGNADLDWVEAGVSALISEQLARRGISVVSSRDLEQLGDFGKEPANLVDAAETIGVNRVYAPRLIPDAEGYRLELVSLTDATPTRMELTGPGPATLSLTMAGLLADQLRAPKPQPAGALGLGNSFLNEAYARAYHHRQTGDYDEAVRLYEYILSEAPDADWAQYHLSITARYIGEVERSRELLETLRDKPLSDAWLAAGVRTTLGNLEWYAGNLDLAQALYQDAGERFAANDMIEGEASSLGNLSMVMFSRGDFDAGRIRAQEALEIYRQQGNWLQQARVLHNIGYSHFDQGNYEQALEWLEQAYAMRSENGLRDQAANTRSVIAEIALEQGRLDEGQRMLEQSLDDFEASGNERRRGVTLTDLADVAARRGHYGLARDYGLEALALASARGEPTSTANASMMVGRANHALGDFLGAEEYYRRAGDQWQDVDNVRGVLASLGERARLALDRGDLDQARELIDILGQRTETLDDARYRRIHRSLEAQKQILLGQPDAIMEGVEAILEDSSERSALRAELIAEIADRLFREDPKHHLMERLWPLINDWAPRYFPAARLLYSAASTPAECRSAIRILEQLHGSDWQASLPESPHCRPS